MSSGDQSQAPRCPARRLSAEPGPTAPPGPASLRPRPESASLTVWGQGAWSQPACRAPAAQGRPGHSPCPGAPARPGAGPHLQLLPWWTGLRVSPCPSCLLLQPGPRLLCAWAALTGPVHRGQPEWSGPHPTLWLQGRWGRRSRGWRSQEGSQMCESQAVSLRREDCRKPLSGSLCWRRGAFRAASCLSGLRGAPSLGGACSTAAGWAQGGESGPVTRLGAEAGVEVLLRFRPQVL